MGIFSDIVDFIKDLVNMIVDAIKKVLDELGPFLPLLLIAAFIFAPELATFFGELGWTGTASVFSSIGTTFGAFGQYGLLAAGLGVSAVLLPEETTELVEKIGEVAGGVAGVVGTVLGAGVGGAIGSFFEAIPTPVLVIGGGLLAWWLLSDNGNDNSVAAYRDSQEQIDEDLYGTGAANAI
jgi:hypothetical protein